MNPLNFLFRSRPATGPRGHRAYAIGDVHGRLDLLERLLGGIETEIAEAMPGRASIVLLGDLIDRGPQSAQVIEKLRTYRPNDAEVHFIAGNHEEVLLRILQGETGLIASWMRFGGAETLRSYGLDPHEVAGMPETEAATRLRQAVPAEHQRFLESFADSISFGRYLFVHAGIRPGVQLADQSKADLRWIRGPFLDDKRDHGFIVVHGHTIRNSVEVTPNRVGIDTGAYCTNVLTALAIEGASRWLIQTSAEGVTRSSFD